jgi:hypothetical protein
MRSLLPALTLFAFVVPGEAMEFELRGEKILATGEIHDGDAEKFVSVVATVPKVMGTPLATVSFDSAGGDLFEGMRLGDAIRTAGIPTLVERSRVCIGACALAFLGGKITGVVSDAVGRKLEVGARLELKGFTSSGDNVHLANGSLDSGRLANGLILQYAATLGAVDLVFLSTLLNGPLTKLEPISTPRQIRALGIVLKGDLPKLPKGWPILACLAELDLQRSPLDRLGLREHIAGEPEPISTVEALRVQLLDDKYPADAKIGPIREAIQSLPTDDALDVLAGGAVWTDFGGLEAWRVQLTRGQGYYFDACYAITDLRSIWTVLIDGISPMAVTRLHRNLAGFPADEPLWK